MYRLLNSAMMPVAGRYHLIEVTPEDFGTAVRGAHCAGTLRSYIGYPQTAAVVERLAGVPVPVCRDQTDLDDGDTLLIIRLRYRVANPATKGEPVTEDFQFFVCTFETL